MPNIIAGSKSTLMSEIDNSRPYGSHILAGKTGNKQVKKCVFANWVNR